MFASDRWRRYLALWVVVVAVSARVVAQAPPSALKGVTHSRTLMFLTRDGKCVSGTISEADSQSIRVQPFKQPEVVLERSDLVQVEDGYALLFSARSSWNDVIATHLDTGEALLIVLRSGERFTGRPVKVEAESITLKHGLSTTEYPKADVVRVTYLVNKPATDSDVFALEVFPEARVFFPEFYLQRARLWGRLSVRLYDASMRQDDGPGIERCSKWPVHLAPKQ